MSDEVGPLASTPKMPTFEQVAQGQDPNVIAYAQRVATLDNEYPGLVSSKSDKDQAAPKMVLRSVTLGKSDKDRVPDAAEAAVEGLSTVVKFRREVEGHLSTTVTDRYFYAEEVRRLSSGVKQIRLTFLHCREFYEYGLDKKDALKKLSALIVDRVPPDKGEPVWEYLEYVDDILKGSKK